MIIIFSLTCSKNDNLKLNLTPKSQTESTCQLMQIRGDMIETYKILAGKYDLAAVPNFTYSYNYR